MIQLEPIECRVLGVLIEKAQTTPQQYPMSLNALTNGCNQKNNREPVLNVDEETVFDAIETLRQKGFVRQVELSGSRVAKFRHVARETIDVDTNQLVVLAELLLRGPQTLGELRGRASRMHPIESLEVVQNIVQSLIDREEPLVKKLPPLAGSRADRCQQLLCPKLHPIVAPAVEGRPPVSTDSGGWRPRVEELEARVKQLEEAMQRIETALSSTASSSTS